MSCGCIHVCRCWSSWQRPTCYGCRPSGSGRYEAPQGCQAVPLGRWRSRCRWQRYAQSRWSRCQRGSRPSGTLRWPHSMRWGFSVPLASTSDIGSTVRLTAAERSWARCYIFAASARNVAVRDAWLGWSTQEQQRFRYRVVANSRFLIRRGVRVPHLASHALALARRRLPGWLARFSRRLGGHGRQAPQAVVRRRRRPTTEELGSTGGNPAASRRRHNRGCGGRDAHLLQGRVGPRRPTDRLRPGVHRVRADAGPANAGRCPARPVLVSVQVDHRR